MNDSEQMMTRYLLGELSESEQADLERRYFADSAFFGHLSQFESDLIDDYARGRLSPEMRERFERVYLANPERRARLRFSEALVAKLDRDASSRGVGTRLTENESWRTLFAPLIGERRAFAISMALALLLLVLGSAWLFLRTSRLRNELAQSRATETARERHERELQQQLNDEQAKNQQLIAELDREHTQPTPEIGTAPPKNSVPTFVSLLLVASGVRGAETKSPTLSIPAGTQDVHIQLKTSENEYQSYQLELRAVGGKEIFNRKSVKPTVTKSGASFAFSLPASKFTSGDYILTLRGVMRTGEVEDVSKSLFRVEKK